MAFAAKDGSKFTNADTMRSHNAMSSSKAPAAPVAEEHQGPPPIEQDPEAMQCIQILQQKGYTADDVEQAMGQSEGQEQQAPPRGSNVMPNFGPLQSLADKVAGLPQKGLDLVAGPASVLQRGAHGIENMLGLSQPDPTPPGPDPTWHNQMVQKANQSFQQPPNPVVAPPRRKMMNGY